MLRVIAVLGIAVSMLIFVPTAAVAQDDVLVAAQAPGPEQCTLEPRTIEDLEILVRTRPQLDVPAASPTALPDPFEVQGGFSLFEDELIEIEKDLTRAVACFNTGDPLKVFATYTDRYVLELIDRLGGLTDEVIAGLTTVRPLDPSDYIQIIGFDESRLLDDGRVIIVVSGDDPTDDIPPGHRAFYLEEVLPGRWLIDEVVEITVE